MELSADIVILVAQSGILSLQHAMTMLAENDAEVIVFIYSLEHFYFWIF